MHFESQVGRTYQNTVKGGIVLSNRIDTEKGLQLKNKKKLGEMVKPLYTHEMVCAL